VRPKHDIIKQGRYWRRRSGISVELQTPSPSGSTADSGQRTQRDALRAIALAFQMAVRGSYDAASFPPQSNEVSLSELHRLVEAYATAQRADDAAPEQVLARIKSVTHMLTTELSHDVTASASRTVLDAFLVGFYGDVSVRSRSGRA
jgi:hypothetical protein